MDVGVAGPGLSCSLASVVVLLQLQSARKCGAADRVSIVGFLCVPSFASLRSSLSCVTRAMCGREPRPAEVVVSLLGTISPPYVRWLYTGTVCFSFFLISFSKNLVVERIW